MKRTGFKRKTPQPRPCKTYEVYTPRPRPVAVARTDVDARMCVPIPKQQPIQHEGYMALVRKMPCYRCGIVGFTQFCHADEGKGTGIKTDCRLGWPGCGPHYENGVVVPGCHYVIGSTGTLTKEERRSFERRAGEATRRSVAESGLWPCDLEVWMNDVDAV